MKNALTILAAAVKDMEESTLQSLLTASTNLEPKINTKTKSDIPEDQILKTVGLIREQFNLKSNELAFTGIAILLQKGGCNSNKNTNIVITIDDKSMDSKSTNKIIREICKGATPRSFARQHGKTIFEISKKHKIVGNIALKIQRNYPEAWNRITNPDKEYWASDFQTDTEGIPPEVANLIQTNYEAGFASKNKKA